MRPAVRTPRQARDRLSVALSAATEVFRAARTMKEELPDPVIEHTVKARSHLRAAIDALTHRNAPST
jgi:hypothetical protein